jgi:hypothetical protein
VLTLPTVLNGLGTAGHTIGIELSSTGGAGSISVAAGSSLYATSYNTTGGVDAVSTSTADGANLGAKNLTLGGKTTAISVNVPTNNSATFFDVNGTVVVRSTAAGNFTLTAQYLINGVATGPIYSIDVSPAGVGTLTLPTQFTSLVAGQSVAIQLSTPGSAQFNLDADTLSVIAHNSVPSVGTPEPASLSLACMAALAFGGAAYRRRRQNKAAV